MLLKEGFLASNHHSLSILAFASKISEENSLFTVAGPRRTFTDFPF